MFNELLFFLEVLFLFASARFAVKKSAVYGTALLCLQAVFANVFVLKQITLFKLNVTASDSLAVGTVLTLNLLQEYYGKEEARKASNLSLICLVFCSLLSLFQLFFTPSDVDYADIHYQQLLAINPRIALASLLAFYVSLKTDIWLFGFLKKRLKLPLSVRSALSSLASQILDTALFAFLGLYGVVSKLSHVMLLSFTIKGILIVSFALLLFLNKKKPSLKVSS